MCNPKPEVYLLHPHHLLVRGRLADHLQEAEGSALLDQRTGRAVGLSRRGEGYESSKPITDRKNWIPNHGMHKDRGPEG